MAILSDPTNQKANSMELEDLNYDDFLSEMEASEAATASYEMLQRYIRALADSSVIVLIIPREWHPLGAVARMGFGTLISSDCTKFLVIALRTANRHF